MAVVTTDLWGQVVDEWETRFDAEAPAFADVVPDLNQRLAGAAVVAHNAEYDLAFVRAEYRRAGWKLPQVPTLSTLEASAYYLPSLRRRRLADLSSALGTAAADDGSTLDDARTTAVLLAEFISPKPGKPPLPAHLDGLPARAQKVTWPSGPTLEPQEAPPAGATPDPTPGFTLVERFSLIDALDEGAPAGTFAYLEKLAEVLEDGSVTTQETSELARVAAAEELTSDDVARANEAFVRALTYAALDDGTVSADEHTELLTVTDLLGVGRPLVEEILATAEKARRARESADLKDLPQNWALGEPLRVGDRVVFTGGDPEAREQLETRSQRLGVRVVGTVSETTALLISDDTVDGTRAARAREVGTRQVTPDEYALLLDHLQPAASRETATEPAVTAEEPVLDDEKPEVLEPVAPVETPVLEDAETTVPESEPAAAVIEEHETSEPKTTVVAEAPAVTEASAGEPVLEDAETAVPTSEPVGAVVEPESKDAEPSVPESEAVAPVEEPVITDAKVTALEPEPASLAVVEPVAADAKPESSESELPAPAAVESEVAETELSAPVDEPVLEIAEPVVPVDEPVDPKVTDEEAGVAASTMVGSDVVAPARKPRAPRKPRASIPKIAGPNSADAESVAAEPEVVTEVAPVTKPRASRAKAAPQAEVVEEQLDVVVAKKAAPRKTAASRAKATANPVTAEAEAPVAPPKTAEVRAWARANGHPVSVRGALPKELIAAYIEARSGR
ncbi:Lsr2 family DNA-binding protein [Kineosporia mesophila]|nr:histone-like nucleoid-structuring protein Lsr2 [Kineosporia mesophila]MCD5355216.1 Lsr2 family protein [Kineosporia mesophila]